MSLLYQYTLYFAIYSVAGWIIETTFCTIKFRKFENKGFLIGPLCPIYATGAILTVLVMSLLPKNFIIISIATIFFLGLILASLVEYFTGWLLEVLFNTKWWDYSEEKFNIKGRVCLENSIYFGVMCVILVKVVHPVVISIINMLSPVWTMYLALIFIVFLFSDIIITVFTVLNLNKRLSSINAGMMIIKEKLDSFEWYNTFGIKERIQRLYENRDKENPIFTLVMSLHENIKRIESDNKSLQIRILQAFPDLKSLKYPEYLNAIKEQIGIFRHRKSKGNPQDIVNIKREPEI